jgi:hypothetical protein
VELRDDDPLGPVHDERAVRGHEGHVSEIDVLLDRLFGPLPLFLLRGEPQPRLERNRVGQALVGAPRHGLLGRTELVLEKLQRVVLPAVRDRKVFVEDRLQPLVFPLLRRGLILHEVVERLQLDVQKIGVFVNGIYPGKRNTAVARR